MSGLFTVCVIVSNLFGLITYSLDVYSDLALGVLWLKLGHPNWGAATLAFFLIPGVVNSVIGAIFARRFFVGAFRYVALFLCSVLAAPLVSSLERIMRRLAKVQLRWDVWQAPGGEVYEGEGAGAVGSIGSRQRAIEVTLEAIPQIGLQLYIAAKQNALGGLQFFTLSTSTIGAVLTVVYALDDVVSTPMRRHLFDCSNVFRPALAIGAAFWCLLALLAHLPAVAFFGAVTHGGALVLGLLLYLQMALTALPLHLGKRNRTRANRILVGVPSLALHCLMTGAVILLAQMWFIRVKTFAGEEAKAEASVPAFVWPDPPWPMSEWKRAQFEEKTTWMAETSLRNSSSPLWADCVYENLSKNGSFFTKDWWKEDLTDNVKELASKDLTCLTDHAEEILLYLMWINFLFFILQFFVLTFLNVVDTRAYNL